MTRPHPIYTLFPYTTLFRSERERRLRFAIPGVGCPATLSVVVVVEPPQQGRRRSVVVVVVVVVNIGWRVVRADRKSTRLNSSHVRISYAVFCLKKKKNHAA